MALHWEGADERAALAYQYVEPTGFEIYGVHQASRSSRACESRRQPVGRR